MEDRIQVGEELLDYYDRLSGIKERISGAFVYAQMAYGIVMDTEIYEGDASAEMNIFYGSMLNHLQRLMMFYEAAAGYLMLTYSEHYYSDEQTAQWIIGMVQEGQNEP